MKKQILLIGSLLVVGILQAQIQVNNGINSGIANSNVLLDGSTAFSKESGAQANTGKGIVIPSVDLVNFQFDLTLADGVTFPTYFDGMMVYNNATGNTLTTGNRPSASVAVVPGFYYFSNPNGAVNGNVNGGQWKPLGSTNPGDNLGNHLATQNVVLNNNQLQLRGNSDTNHGLGWNPAFDGPRLWGYLGGALGTSTGTANALTWNNAGKLTFPNASSTLQWTNSLYNRKIVLWEDAANDHQYAGLGINSFMMRYQVANTSSSHAFFAGTSATGSNELLRITGTGNVGIGTAAPTDKLDIASGSLRVRNLPAGNGTASIDRLVVADTNGVLKTLGKINDNYRVFYAKLGADQTVTTNITTLLFTAPLATTPLYAYDPSTGVLTFTEPGNYWISLQASFIMSEAGKQMLLGIRPVPDGPYLGRGSHWNAVVGANDPANGVKVGELMNLTTMIVVPNAGFQIRFTAAVGLTGNQTVIAEESGATGTGSITHVTIQKI